MVLPDTFGADPASSCRLVKEMDMQLLVFTAAAHLLPTQRLENNHAGPPWVSLQFCPNQCTCTEGAWGAGKKVEIIGATFRHSRENTRSDTLIIYIHLILMLGAAVTAWYDMLNGLMTVLGNIF